MSYEIEYTDIAKSDIEKHKKSGDKKLLRKLDDLLNELREHPASGTGQPEQLKHYEVPTWSRRISQKHRLVYEIRNNVVTVLILSAYGHYNDK